MDKEPTIEQDPQQLKKIIDGLCWFKDGWKSEIPVQTHPDIAPDLFYKVRKNWWGGLAQQMEKVLSLLLMNPEKHASLIKEINNFFSQFCCIEFTNRFTTKEDIETAENLIDKVVLELKNLQNNI